MTEEEAKAKWCPFARTAYLPKARNEMPPAFNRTFSIDGGMEIGGSTKCLGSSCMAWRWESVVHEVKADDPDGLPAEDPRTRVDIRHAGPNNPRRFLPATGFCGLAGHP